MPTSLTITPSSLLVSFSDDENDDLGDPHLLPPQDPPHIPKGVHVIVEAIGSLASDPSTSCCTYSHTIGSSLLSHAICDDSQKNFIVIGNLEWDHAMEEEYSSLMKNHTWDLCPLPKGRKLV